MPGDFDSLADKVVGMQQAYDRSRATSNLAAAQGANPDAEAKALAASRTLGIPQPAALAEPEAAQSSAQMASNVQALSAAPGLSAWIGSNPLSARLAQDDFDKLGLIDRIATALKTGVSTAVASNELGRLGNLKQGADLFGVQTPQVDQAIQTTEGRIAATPRLNGAMGTVQQFTGFLSGLVDNAVQGGLPGAGAGAAIGGAGGAVAGGIGAVPGAIAGAGTGAIIGFNADMALSAAGNAYLKMGQMRDAGGQPLSEAGKQFGAIFTGVATYALGRYGSELEAKALGGGAEKVAQDAIEQAVQSPTFAKALGNVAIGTAKASASGAVVMSAMEASSIIGEQIAKAVSPGNFGTDMGELRQRLADAAINGALMVGALHATTGGVGLYSDLRASQRAEAQTTMFQNLMTGAEQSKLRGRDLNTFQDFMQSQTGGSPVENLYVAAAKVRELYQGARIDPATLDPAKDPIFGFVPDMAKQLAEASESGGDVVIPTADFVAHLAGSPIAEKLMPDLRVGADAMSVNEAKQFQKEYAARLKDAADQAAKAPAEPDAGDAIADDVRQRAIAAGRPEAEASRYGQIFASRYTARAERLGQGDNALAMYQDRGVQIGADTGGKGRTLNQGAAPEDHVGSTLMELGKHEDLFQYPKSKATDLETIAKDKDPAIKVERESITQMDGSEKDTGHFRVELPEGGKGTISEKDGKVWINASGVGEGKGGSLLYDLAANYARNKGLKFIGDPDGLSDAGMRRRLENMISSAVKYGTTEHLAPHDRQLNGDTKLGLPPLKWEDGAHAENLRSMVRAQVATNEHASPLATSLEYDPHADAFRDASGDVVEDAPGLFTALAGEDRGDAGAGAPGRTSVQRTALFRSLLSGADARRALLARVRGQSDGGGPGAGSLDRSFYQSVGDEPRGSIRFDDGRAVIHLLAKADSSTLIHEAGHAWLEELALDAATDAAPAQLRDDMSTVRTWLGNDGGEFTTDQHEQFARAAERYLMEGKAPSAALARVFSRFKQWLTKIYRTVTALDTPINDDIRQVFDRLLATDDELDRAKRSTGLEPNFTDRKQAGMTQAEWGAYLRTIDKANQDAESTMLGKMMASVRNQRTAEYRAERRGVADKVAETVDARPDMQALNLLRRGTMPDGTDLGERLRLKTDSIRSTYGKDGLEALPSGITNKNGVEPDYVSEMLGFNSPDEMVRALQSLEGQQREFRKATGDKRTIREYLIDQETDRQMAERKGELEDEASIKEEAVAALHGEGRAELLATELRYLRRSAARELTEKGQIRKAGDERLDAANQEIGDLKETARWNDAEADLVDKTLKGSVEVTKPMLEALRAHVDQILLGKKTADIGRFGTFLRDERKAAREVQQAILAKDWAEAAAAKQRQIVAHVLYTKAKAASAEIDRGTALFERLTKKPAFKGLAQEYTDQIQHLLQRFGFDSGRGEELERTKSRTLQQFVEDKANDSGIELAVDPSLFDLAPRRVADMALQQFHDLHEAVRSMQEIGRGEQLIEIDGQMRNFADVRDEIVAAIRDLGERMKSDFYDPKDAGKLEAARQEIFHQLRSIDASLTKPEALFDQIDKGDPLGIMNQSVFRRLKDAQHREDESQAVASAALKDAVDRAGGKKWSNSLRDVLPDDPNLRNPDTGNAMRLSRQRMISMALNWGNEGNRAKLADGYRWNPRAVKQFLDRHMTKQDWDFVQDVWGIFDSNRDQLDSLQKRVTGVGLDLVNADRFETPHVSYAGGYYPIVYDATRNYKSEAHAEKATADTLFPSGYTRATTPKGSTIARVEGVKRAIELNLDVAPWKIGQVLHDIAFREAIMDSDRLLSDGAVKRAFDDVFGSEYRKTLRPWLKSIANSRNIDDAAIGWIDKAISTARTSTVMVGIGFRLSTILKHDLTALANSIGEIGAKEMFKATADLYRRDDHGDNSWKFIFDKSAEMRFRQNAYDKDTQAAYDHLVGDSAYTAFQKGAQHYGHLAVSKLDMGTAGPVWLASYRKALATGLEDKDAVYVADKAVRNAHGAQGITDTAAIQRANGAAKLINMFYGFFNHVYNRQRLIAIDAASGVKNVQAGQYKAATKDFGSVLARSFWYVAVPGLIEALVASGGGPNEDKDEHWGGFAAKAVLGSIPAGIPIMRDIARAAIEGRDYEGSPLVNAVNSVMRGSKDVYDHYVDGEDWKPGSGGHIATAAGLVTGLPTAAPFNAGKFLWDYGTGEADAHSVKDWYQGLTSGKIHH